MIKLPIWKQSFIVIRENPWEALYIDKTEKIINIINSSFNAPLFFSRPRRFWKSLLIDTIRCMYEWRKELFYDTYAEKNWDFSKTNPVIKISFWSGIVEVEDFEVKIEEILRFVAEDLKIEKLTAKSSSWRLEELIRKTYEKYNKKVVILIDEYDKLILDFINKSEDAKIIREKLKTFYWVLKDTDEYIELLLITWVSKFSKVSLFSGLNNLEDITLNPIAWELVWFTEQEITDNFWEYLNWVNRKKMKSWYNWFNFLWENRVYNPYDVLLFLKNKEYKSHWFETATPTFLIKLLKDSDNFYHIPNLEKISVWDELLSSFDLENISIETLLFQTGYLTIKDKINSFWQNYYNLGVPNKEINQALNKYIISDYLQAFEKRDFFERARPVYFAMQEWNIDKLIEAIKTLFANIAYSSIEKIAKYEWYYSSVIFTLFCSMWFDIVQEDITNQWRIDLTIKVQQEEWWSIFNYFVLEFKVEKSGDDALKQIQNKKYSEKYVWLLKDTERLFEVGINFSFKDRNVESYDWGEIFQTK